MKLYLSAAAGGMGVLVTLLWVPELSTLDLAEGDLRWAALCRGALAEVRVEGIGSTRGW